MNNFKINYGPKIDYKSCNRCGDCYKNCPMDVFGWDEEKQMPTVAYGGECSICCYCETLCPQVAIDVRIPLPQMLDFGISPATLRKKSKFLGEE